MGNIYGYDGQPEEPKQTTVPKAATPGEAELARLGDLGARHGLSVAEVQAAEATGMEPSEYAVWRNVSSPDDAEAAERAVADKEEALVEARRMLAVEAARKRIAAEVAS